MVRVGKYDYSKSTNAGKKLMVVVIKNGKKKQFISAIQIWNNSKIKLGFGRLKITAILKEEQTIYLARVE